jgi:hypothetical protein
MRRQRKKYQMLEYLADALVEEVLNTSDEDILKEAQEDYGDPKYEVNKAFALMGEIVSSLRKQP